MSVILEPNIPVRLLDREVEYMSADPRSRDLLTQRLIAGLPIPDIRRDALNMTHGDRLYLGAIRGRTSGSMGFLDFEVMGGECSVVHLGTEPEHRRKGVATALVNSVERYAKGVGAEIMTAVVQTDLSDEAWPFWKRMGYSIDRSDGNTLEIEKGL